MRIVERQIRFVLSAGRTGTVFLSRALAERFPDVRCEHEPWPGRWEFVLANARNRTGFGDSALRALFVWSRRRRIADGESAIEINPLLCPMTDIVAATVEPLHIIHLVRHPATWAKSIINFKASGWRRHVIDVVPFTKPYPVPRPAGWRALTEYEHALWRWRFCNERILALKAHAQSFITLTYESLFSADSSVRGQTLEKLLSALELPLGKSLDWFDIEVRANPSQAVTSACPPVPDEALKRICGALMERLGYAPDRVR